MTARRYTATVACCADCPHLAHHDGQRCGNHHHPKVGTLVDPLASIPDWCPLPMAGEYPNQDNPRAPDYHNQDNERRLADFKRCQNCAHFGDDQHCERIECQEFSGWAAAPKAGGEQ